VQEIASARDASPAQVILAWHMAQGRIVIPKSRHTERMKENLAATELELSAEELARIDGLETGERQNADPAEKNN
ncbi:MAG: aldo/keto reductase, partial [Ancrocorticia sp.]|nr:aldo/keto reductase [Ancrocorticia sp.]